MQRMLADGAKQMIDQPEGLESLSSSTALTLMLIPLISSIFDLVFFGSFILLCSKKN